MIYQCISVFRNGLEYKNADWREKQWDEKVESKEETVKESQSYNN